MTDLPRFVGPFEVRDRLGHGGMGMVYLAHDPMLDRPVAVKVLRVPDDETRRRFLREARLHAKVQHPHIVNIYAVGEHEGQPYLAMEYIAGSTLAAIIRNEDEVPLARKVAWLAELAAGLDHAHHYGIVHRDVKPSNILITRDSGRLRLLDFGIAHGQEALGMTMAGMVIGTPQYMSPEQITGKPVDARSDIFSVGLVGYELLTGRQAFGGDNVFDISRRIVSEAPAPLATACPEVPAALVRVIEKCLEKAPEHRYQTGRQLERELLAIARRLDPDHTVISSPLTAPTLVAGAGDGADPDPSTAAAALASRVRQAVQEGRLDEAEQLLRELQARHARVPGLSGLRVLVEEARLASQAINLAGDAERALARQHLTEAQALIEDIERLAPTWDGLASLRQQLQALLHERRVDEALQRVRGCLDAGALDEAEPALRQLAALAPGHPQLSELRSRYHQRIAAQQAATLAGRARVALQQDALDEAAALVAEALAISPGNDEALAVQELVGQRRRAQRVARAAQKVLAAIDSGQPVSARRALDQLQRLDAAHPDLDALRVRVERLERGEEPDTTTGLAVVTASTGAPRTAAPSPPTAAPAPAAMSVDDDLLISRPDLPAVSVLDAAEQVDTTYEDGPAGASRARVGIAAAVLLVAAALGYWFFVHAPSRTALASATIPDTTPLSTTAPDSLGADIDMQPADLESVAPADPSGAASLPSATSPSDARGTEGPARLVAPADASGARAGDARASRERALERVRQMASAGQVPEAFAALSSVPGLAGDALGAEERRLAEAAREHAEMARRAAADLRAGSTDAFLQGTSRQTLGDQHFKAGRMRDAAHQYVQARDAFVLALAGGTGGRAAEPAGAAGAVAATGGGATTPTVPAGAPSASTSMSRFTREQIENVIARFRQAYESRSVDAIRRVWPSLDPPTERRFRGTFGIPGELQWIPLGQKIVRQDDRATVTATVLSISPLPQGQDRREITVTMEVVPQGDGLVIAGLRQQ